MTRRRHAIAKLTRPRLASAVPRERLFARLDQLSSRSLIWVSGPAGCGKTTLVSTYLEARDRPAFWYHVDPADSDPATFFYYLSELAEPLRRRNALRLPFLAPEYLAEIAIYTRRFFRLLFERLPDHAVLVLDDLHESGGGTLAGILRDALNELPAGKCVIGISRAELPRELSRHAVNESVGVVGWEDLRLRRDESGAVIQARSARLEDVDRLHERTGGWVAGLLLLLAARDAGTRGLNPDAPSAVFDYFAGELFDRLDAPDQELLLATALLPRFTADMARELTGQQDAGDRLDRLQRSQLFLQRSIDEQDRRLYVLHDLFRDFLLHRGRGSLSPDVLNRTRGTAALILIDEGAHDAAVDLLLQAGDHDSLQRIILQRAESLLAQGRWKTLLTWLGAIPEAMRLSSPWCLFWMGLAHSATNAQAARALLERALEGFDPNRDLEARVLCCARIMDTYLQEWNTVQSLDHWIAEMGELLARAPALTDRQRLRTLSTLVHSLTYRQPGHPSLQALAEEAAALLERVDDPGDCVAAAACLFICFDVHGSFERVEQLIGKTETAVRSDEIMPAVAFLWWHFSAIHFHYKGDFSESERRRRHSLDIAETHGMRALRSLNSMVAFMNRLAEGDVAAAQISLDELAHLVNPVHYMHVLCLQWGRQWREMITGDRARQDEEWSRLLVMPPAGVPWNTVHNHPAVMYLAQRGQHAAALDRIRAWREVLNGLRSPLGDFNLLCMEAYVRLDQGDEPAGRPCLERMMTLGARQGYFSTLAWIPGMMAFLCAKALDWNIEPDYVRKLIRLRLLSAPALAGDNWPRRMRILLLGRFEVQRDEVPLEFPRKAPRKILTLLKAIASAGPAGLSTGQAADWLWPDLDGDAAQDALGTSLHRLRRLIGLPEAVVLHEGHLRIDPELCWTDCAAFEQLVQESEIAADSRHAVRRMTGVLDLYRGGLLPLDRDEHWLAPARERLRGKFLRFVSAFGRQLEEGGNTSEAVASYRRGLDADPLAEEFYQGLMRCHAAQGRTADALSVYRQLRQVLKLAAGAEPSVSSRTLHARLTEASP
jgi:ATP/maltotriose-dependent transcriptional regulator MalT/DNA-binding SARP family transcriptional activator